MAGSRKAKSAAPGKTRVKTPEDSDIRDVTLEDWSRLALECDTLLDYARLMYWHQRSPKDGDLSEWADLLRIERSLDATAEVLRKIGFIHGTRAEFDARQEETRTWRTRGRRCNSETFLAQLNEFMEKNYGRQT